MPKLLTIIIPEHNEGDFVNGTLDSLFATSDRSLYDVIVVSDGSTVPLNIEKYHVSHYKNTMREGVGASFDIGALMAETPYLVLMGCDVRFRNNDYIPKMIEILGRPENENAIISVGNIGMSEKNMDVNNPKNNIRYGAEILFFMTYKDLPKKGVRMRAMIRDDVRVDNFRNIIEAKWLIKPKSNIESIPCVLGAFYGIHKAWYDKIHGWRGHRFWGTLEPFISLKSWLCGGSCKITTDISVGHIFTRISKKPHVTRDWDLLYNKVFLINLLFDPETVDLFMEFLGKKHPVVNKNILIAEKILQEHKDVLQIEKDYLSLILKHDLHWFNKQFPFKYYNEFLGTEKMTLKHYFDETDWRNE